MNKNILAGLAVSAAMAMAASAPVMANSAAIVIEDAGCYFLDGYGNTFYFAGSHEVDTSGGTTNVKCYATGVPRDPGKAIRYTAGNTGYSCSTQFGATDRWWEVIDSEGNATVTCQIKK